MVGVALQVVGILLVAAGLMIVHPAVFCLVAGAAMVAAPHLLTGPVPDGRRHPDEPVRVR